MVRTFLLARRHRRARRALVLGIYLVSATQLALASSSVHPPKAMAAESDRAPVEVPSEVGREIVVAKALSAGPDLVTPRPTEWMPARGAGCDAHGRSRACSGMRRTPVPHGEAAELAVALGLGDRRAARISLGPTIPAAWLEAAKAEVRDNLLFPTPFAPIGRGVGFTRNSPGLRGVPHLGVDLGARAGAQVRAVNDGLVTYSDAGMSGYGNSILLLHGDGTVTLYAHCAATYVFAGQRVRRGQVIGEVGATGLAHGPHLHFEWRRGGQALDPRPSFVGRNLPIGQVE